MFRLASESQGRVVPHSANCPSSQCMSSAAELGGPSPVASSDFGVGPSDPWRRPHTGVEAWGLRAAIAWRPEPRRHRRAVCSPTRTLRPDRACGRQCRGWRLSECRVCEKGQSDRWGTMRRRWRSREKTRASPTYGLRTAICRRAPCANRAPSRTQASVDSEATHGENRRTKGCSRPPRVNDLLLAHGRR